MEGVFIICGEYFENGQKEFDILLVTESDEKRIKFIKEYDLINSGYDRLQWGLYDIE